MNMLQVAVKFKNVCKCRAHPAIIYLLLKMYSGYKYKSLAKSTLRCLKNYIKKKKKCILIRFWIFQNCFYYSFTLYYCTYLTLWMLDFSPNTIRVSNSLDPDQARHFVGPDLGPNCLQRFQQKTKVTASGQRVR